MALRLIEIILQQKDSAELGTLLKEHAVLEHRQLVFPNGEVLERILLDAERNEAVLDLLEQRYTAAKGNRVVILPVEATLPRAEPKSAATSGQSPPAEKLPARIAREELYEDIKDSALLTGVYLAMVALSTVVAAIGLYYGSVAIIIGAMVIAPLLGPNMALALATTLGDLPLLRRALVTSAAGIVTTMILSTLIGLLLQVDPVLPELASRDTVSIGDVVVALASGVAGALAFTSGVSATLIGVMVAVSLLPPLVTFGLLLGGGHAAPAIGALSLSLMNLICVNLAGVATFLMQGIRPASWWEKDRAGKATRIAIALWATLFGTLLGLILFLRNG
jgi:uncharacterized hydrophobic protein (TIGR00341 family)